ncbi:LuxR C-terminal-related transcriptional regulator [Amycolatopsis sp. NPDC005961]|uniref:helix-turn-helix transcriptional regulator n=1 Tax=Amycolatopsis sp. NPDC005961 TaxID=3156720 RepID=UPI0033D7680B
MVSAVFSHTTVAGAAEAASAHALDVLVTTTAELDETVDVSATQHLRGCGVRLLVLVGAADRVQRKWVSHAQGFVDRSALHLDVLQEAVIDVVAGRFHVSASLARRLLGPADSGPGTTLTARELQVLRLVSEGKSNKQAARGLGISENGVKRLMGNILAKLNSPNRTLAVVRALELGLLGQDSQAQPAGQLPL